MATVQQLEKLYQIQRLFYVEDSLEAAVAGERVAALISRTEQQLRQRAFLRDERRRLRISSDLICERKRALEFMRRDDWLPPDIVIVRDQRRFLIELRSASRKRNELQIKKAELIEAATATGTEVNTEEDTQLEAAISNLSASINSFTVQECELRHVMINIGGLMFEAPESVLTKDPDSLLAQLCSADPPIRPDPQGGFFYFDRDWWLFRYILTFLRDGTLPDDRNLLSQLYREGSFWHLVEMQRAIENQKLHLADAAGDKWWGKLPSWWLAVDEAKQKQKTEAEAATPNEDWWTGTSYKGKKFLPLSSDPEKTVADAGEIDAKPLEGSSTWNTNNEYDTRHSDWQLY